MQKQNDIYRKDNPILPKRRRDRRGGGAAPDRPFPSPVGSTSRRDRPHMPVGNVDGRTDQHYRPRSNRRRPKNKGMSWTQKVLFGSMSLLMVGYLGLLAYSLMMNRAPAPVATPQQPPTVSDAAPAPSVVPQGIVGEETPTARAEQRDRARVQTLTESVERWKAGLAQAERSRTARERSGDLAASVVQLEQALAATPALLDVKLELANTYAELNQYDEACEMYLALLEADPQRHEVRLKLALLLLSMQQHRSALTVAEWLLEADSFAEQPNYVAAMSLIGLGRLNEAIPHLRRLVSLNRENLLYRNNLAVTYSRLGLHEQAETLLREVLNDDPSNSITYYNLAVSYAQRNAAQPAVEILTSAARRFGMSFVNAWLESREFDPIRDTAEFRALREASPPSP